jgi:hypothetical protein
MAKAPNQTTVAGIEWAATHDFPNDDLTVTGGAGGWPPSLFGEKRSRALVANGITTFTQLMAEVKSRTKEDFYREFGTCDGKVGVLDTAANTMWEVCMAWDYAYSFRRPAGESVGTSTDAWLTFADTHNMPDENLSLGVNGGWPPGCLGPQRIAKLKAKGITLTSQLMHHALHKSYDAFIAEFGGSGALDSRAGGIYGFLHRIHAANSMGA